MSKQRVVSTCFWDDPYIMKLDPSEKLLFLYLLTNPLTEICGVYQISIKRISFDTGFEQDVVRTILARFEKDERCIYRGGWIAMKHWLKHQSRSPGVQAGIAQQLEAVPQELAEYVRGEKGDSPPTVADSPALNSIESNSMQCKAGSAEKAPVKTLLKFSFNFQNGFVGIPHEDLQRWTEAYPAVNIALEIKRAAEWLRSNPTKLKHNYRRFLTNWFSRCQEWGGTRGYSPLPARLAGSKPVEPPAPLSDTERRENLQELSALKRKLAKAKHMPQGDKRYGGK